MTYLRSNYPTTIDKLKTLPIYQDMTIEDKRMIGRYQVLIEKNNLTSDEQAELSLLVERLRDKMINSEDWNKLIGAVLNLETYFKDNVLDHIDDKLSGLHEIATNTVNTVNDAKTQMINSVNQVRTEVISEIKNTKDTTISEIKNTKDTTISEVLIMKNDAVQSINTSLNQANGVFTEMKKIEGEFKTDLPILNDCVQRIEQADEQIKRLQDASNSVQDDIAKIESTGNKEILISTSEWTLNGDVYEKEITHNLCSENLHVTAKNSDTKEAVTIGYKILDKTRILLKSDEAIPLSLILSASFYNPLITSNVDEGEIVRARKGESGLDVKIAKIDEQLDNIVQQIELNVDMFNGSDYEKLQECINYCTNNDGYYFTVKLNRSYDITGHELICDYGFDKIIKFTGGSLVKKDNGFIFNSSANDNSRNAIRLENVSVFGDLERYDTSIYVYNGDKFIAPWVSACLMKHIALVTANTFIQTLRIINCEASYTNQPFVKAPWLFDGRVTFNRFEHNTAPYFYFTNEDSNMWCVNSFIFENNLLESNYYKDGAIILNNGIGIAINNNYFEANQIDINLKYSANSMKVFRGSIKNNNFLGTKKYPINIGSGGLFTSGLVVEDNYTNVPNSVFINGSLDARAFNLNNGVVTSSKFSSRKNYYHDKTFKTYPYTQYLDNIKSEIVNEKLKLTVKLANSGDIGSLKGKSFIINGMCEYFNHNEVLCNYVGLITIGSIRTPNARKLLLKHKVLIENGLNGLNNGEDYTEGDITVSFEGSGTNQLDFSSNNFNIVITFNSLPSPRNADFRLKPLNTLVNMFDYDNQYLI